MTTKRGKQKPKVWIARSQADLSIALGVSLDTVKGYAKQGMPGRPGSYHIEEIVPWLRSVGPWRQHIKPESDDPLLDGDVDSPGLERYRLAKAALAELDLEERVSSLIAREKVRAALNRWASVIMRLGERLGKKFGNEAAIAVNDAITECQHIVDHEFSSDEPVDPGAPQ